MQRPRPRRLLRVRPFPTLSPNDVLVLTHAVIEGRPTCNSYARIRRSSRTRLGTCSSSARCRRPSAVSTTRVSLSGSRVHPAGLTWHFASPAPLYPLDRDDERECDVPRELYQPSFCCLYSTRHTIDVFKSVLIRKRFSTLASRWSSPRFAPTSCDDSRCLSKII